MSNIDFKKTVPAAQAGDKAAQDALMANLYGLTVTEAQSVIRDVELARDVAVAFWAWLFQEGGIREYDPAKGLSFKGWAAQWTRYRALDERKRKRLPLVYTDIEAQPEYGPEWKSRFGLPQRLEQDPFHGDFDPDPTAREYSAIRDLEAVAERLDTAQKKNVFWRLIEGATPEDIAEEIGVSVKRVRNLIGDVRAVITAQLDGQ